MDDHLRHVEEMLDRFISVGLTIQPKKSFLFQNELEFLGFTVSKDGIKATDSKLKAITDFPSACHRQAAQRALLPSALTTDVLWTDFPKSPSP